MVLYISKNNLSRALIQFLRGQHRLGEFSAFFDKGKLLCENFCDVCFSAHKIPSEKVSTLKGKNLLPRGANSFLLE